MSYLSNVLVRLDMLMDIFSEVYFILFEIRVLRVEFEALPVGSQEASDRCDFRMIVVSQPEGGLWKGAVSVVCDGIQILRVPI